MENQRDYQAIYFKDLIFCVLRRWKALLVAALIGSQVGGIPELIRDNGYLFPMGDAAALKDRLLQMEQLDRKQYDRMVQVSYDLFDQCYTKQAHLPQLKQIYAKVGCML